jgi:8-oxo-dGTP pyrophosphatase MutT (NUDIX family)
MRADAESIPADGPAKLLNVNIAHVREKLAGHAPEPVDAGGHERAAVAVVLREGPESAEVLLIERAIFEGDPWSGHMAFPGGRMESDDDSTRFTAARETHEEVGVELTNAEYLGHVDELVGNRRVSPRLVVSAHAFHLEADQEFVLDPNEVQQAFWFPLAGLHESARQVEHIVPEMPDVRFPGIVVGQPDRHVVWGLTFRFLERMLQVIEHPFVEPWGNLSQFADRAGNPRER